LRPKSGKAARPGESGFLPPASLLAELRSWLPRLSRAEKRLAELVLGAPAEVTRLPLATFSERAAVSQPTALRFCRRVGCDGFPEFKIRIAQALMSGWPYIHGEIKPGDGLVSVADAVFASSVDALTLIRSQLDMAALARAVEAIARAPRIELLGTGLSSVAAIDAQQKFMRLGVPTSHHPDGHVQRMSAATLKKSDVAIAFSYTGRLRDIVRAAETARAAGATLIAFTRSDSPLAAVADIVIGIDTLENTFVYAPMTTRIAHLVVVDVLATAVALGGGKRGQSLIRKVKQAMSDEWLVGAARPAAGPDN